MTETEMQMGLLTRDHENNRRTASDVARCMRRPVSEINRLKEEYLRQSEPILNDMATVRLMNTRIAIRKDDSGQVTHMGEQWIDETAKETYEMGEKCLQTLRESIFR